MLNELESNDAVLFESIKANALTQAASTGMQVSTVAIALIFQALRDELTKRGDAIVSEIDNAYNGANISDLDGLEKSLKAELLKRLAAVERIATTIFVSSTQAIREQINRPNMPSENALLLHVEKLQPKWLAKVDLICDNLRASQTERLFLKKGEVFAGNRIARAIFESAKKTLDIIDAYFGPKVFDMLEVSNESVQIRVISSLIRDKNLMKATLSAYQDFKKEHGRGELRRCDANEIHDRYVIVDGARAWHFGHSLKDLGEKDSEVNAVPCAEIVQRFEELWQKATPVTGGGDGSLY